MQSQVEDTFAHPISIKHLFDAQYSLHLYNIGRFLILFHLRNGYKVSAYHHIQHICKAFVLT